MTDPQPYGAPPAALRKSLGVLDGVAIAASSTAATTSIGIGLGVTAGVVGLYLPSIMLLAFLPILGIAGAYSRLNMVASGFLAAAWAKWGRRSPYFSTGLGTDADAPQLLAVTEASSAG